MSDPDGVGNPLTEGLGHAARHAAEVAAVVAMAAQGALRARQRHLAVPTDAQHAQLRADQASARLRFAPAFEREFATATAAQAAAVWAAAQPWVDSDPSAARAAARAEDRLGEVVPDLMIHYRERRAAGTEPAEAMIHAHRDWAGTAWAPFLTGAAGGLGPEETLRVWHLTRRWAAHDPEAAEAFVAVEDHLRRLRPAAMADFDRRVALGAEPVAAMEAVTPQLLERIWAGSPVVKGALAAGAAEAAWGHAGAERASAGLAVATADLPSTRLDEHHRGVAEGAGHADVADAAAARAAALAAAAYPQPVGAALASPRSALTARPDFSAHHLLRRRAQ